MDFFKKESPLEKVENNKEKWKIIIADDEEDIHLLTKNVLKKFEYLGKQIEFISTFSGKETIKILKENDDVVLILLDVVMETDTAGLDVTKVIRDDFKNNLIQIVLRTGQAGRFPEYEVITKYEINDYKEKTELTSVKLMATVTTAIRAYENLKKLNKSQSEIKKLNFDLSELLKVFEEKVIAFKSDNEGIINYISDAYLDISLKKREEIIGKSHKFLLCEYMSDEFYNDLCLTLKAGKVWKGEIKEKNAQDKICWLSFVITPAKDYNGEFLNYTAIAHDITLQKHVEEAKKEIEVLNNEIEATQREVVFRLGSVAETRSKETGLHVHRVSEYSKLFALYYGLDKKEAEILKQASPMHDIGKIGIPDSILNKPGKLTQDEFEIMKTHSDIGYEMLKGSDKSILKVAAIVAYEHHEKYDGSGYPRALKGEDIHIYGRITAIADVFDALGSSRCYKKAWDDEKIFNLFKEEKAKHFDPKLIDIFFNNLPVFLNVRDSFKD